jgi:diamine N-acetyltransferase
MRLVIESHRGEVVGAVDIFEFDPQNLRAGVGIVVGADFRRRGYALDALNTLEWYAREVLHLRQLWCSVTADNSASRQLFQRAGYAECGLRRSWILTPDGELDEVLYQKLL